VQGLRIIYVFGIEQRLEVGVIPRGFELFAFDPPFAGVFSAQQVQGDPSQRGQMLSGMSDTHPTLIFVQLHVQDPVQLVFNAPMPAHRALQQPCVGREATQEELLRGWQLPTRAKHFADSLDVYVGSIWSSVSKWCLIGENPAKNIVVTNGCHRLRLRAKMEDRLLDACAFFCSEAYTTQMRALARGSDGLAEIHEDDLSLVLVPLITDQKQRKRVAPFVAALIAGTATLKSTILSMLSENALSLPLPTPRPHHSALV
jgi:hypothetical protein